MAPKLIYTCQQCGHQSLKWLGKCPDCGEWNSLVEQRETGALSASALLQSIAPASPVRFTEIEEQQETRVSSGIAEFDRVLGGGVVPGSLVLLGGDPGIGKSTLLLQVADALSKTAGKILYVSGEESDRQIKLRGERLGIAPSALFLLSETCLERVLDETFKLQPAAVVVDSIQTIFSSKLESAPGSVAQVREVAGQFLIYSKQRSVPVFLIGHVNKEGAIAGPKALEHIVDTVLYFEGERHHNHRIIRAFKNRFGATGELGIFEMTGTGLAPVQNASQLFLSERPVGVAGSVVMAAMEGTRPMLVELQALCGSARYGTARRLGLGVDQSRIALIIAMLEKRLGLQLGGEDIFVNVAGGLTVEEPAADVGIITAILSSFKNVPVDPSTALFGELGLAGEVRAVSHPALRLREVEAMGFRRCVLPESNLASLRANSGGQMSVELAGVRSVADVLDTLF